jgi:hypothetical protein
MKRIYKYPLQTADEQTVVMRAGAWPLCVQVQNGAPCLWAMVDDQQPEQEATFRVIGTGHPIPDADRLGYVGTYQLAAYGLVFHVFTVAKETP